MSLVIAFTGREGAVMAGDLREILLEGPGDAICGFEEELYSGQIRTDSDLRKRAVERGILFRLRDDKCKIWDDNGILVGEVAESDGEQVRKRRLCVACERYAIVDRERDDIILKREGQGSTFVVLGNEVTKRVANTMIRSEWNTGTFPDAVRLIIRIMNAASSRTASVSRAFTILQTRKRADRDMMELIYEKHR
jgi:hypothetical protein